MNAWWRMSRVLLAGLLSVAPCGLEAAEANQENKTRHGTTTLFHAPPSPAEILEALGETSAANPAPTVKHRGTVEPSLASSVAFRKVAFPIFFTDGSSTLPPGAREYVDRMADTLRKSPGLRLAILAHADGANDAQGQRLALRRAEAIRDDLVERHGIDGARLMVNAPGAARHPDPADPGPERHRRVEFMRDR
ncbi:MAG: OmpA family protein [Magnetococcales bacterium]|nr:OmpA family protein [Magnetococcales bacterium]